MSERDSITLSAPAKVNLRLVILGREISGFHSLETLFCAISLADSLTVERAGSTMDFQMDGEIDTGPAGSNLVVRAARKFYAVLGEPPAVRIHLKKVIPSAAGLAGGSSDAATTLQALNLLHNKPFNREQLLQWGSELGSDVPFFLCGSPLALAWGRGERLLPLTALPRRHVVVAHPGEAMPTAAAYAGIAASRGDDYRPPAAIVDPSALRSWEDIQKLAVNDFEPIVFERISLLRKAKDAMASAGMEVALMAGSGSAIFSVSESIDSANDAAERLGSLGMKVWHCHTLQHGPENGIAGGEAP